MSPRVGESVTYGLPANVCQSRGNDHDHHEAKHPVTGAGNGIGLRTAAQRRDFGAVEERPADPSETEEGVEEKEEARGNELARPVGSAGQAGDDGEADGHAARRDHEGFTAAETLDEEDGEKRAQGVFETAHGGDEVRHARREVKGLLEDLVGVGGDHVDAGQLLGGLKEGADGDAV